MRTQFTTIADVTAALFDADPGFSAEITEDQMRDIVRANKAGRYEEIDDEQFGAMVSAAYMTCGADDIAVAYMLAR